MNQELYLKIAVLNECIILQEIKSSPEIQRLIKDKNVQKFIKLSEKTLSNKISEFDNREKNNLLKDPNVKKYLEASEKVGQRIGWIQGGITGGLLGAAGAVGTFASMGVGGIGLAALALLGGIAGGLTTGYPVSKIKGILRRWKTEEEMTKGGLPSGAILRI